MLQLGQFTFLRLRTVGTGGLGTVDQIVVTATNCQHAVGLHLATKRLNDKWRTQPAAQERFEREIAAVRRMSHPRIIGFSGENLSSSTERFYVMPYYQSSLRDALQRRGAGYPWQNVARFGISVAAAMAYAHQEGFIHRDLKPENILLDSDGNPVVADWGLGYFVHKASRVLAKLTYAGMGTEYYCSLEQWNTGKCDERGDIYSLGLVLAELIRGAQVPIRAVGMGITTDIVLDGTFGGAAMNSLLKAMTAVVPDRRVGSMRDVEWYLRAALSEDVLAAL